MAVEADADPGDGAAGLAAPGGPANVTAARSPERGGATATRAVRDIARAEVDLVRARLRSLGPGPDERLDRARYLLSFARLTAFEPGVALGEPVGRRPDVDLTAELAGFRAQVIAELAAIRRAGADGPDLATAIGALVERLEEPLAERRAAVIAGHGADFSAAELDAEVGTRVLVNAAGGGGGAGYVYLGAYQRLDEAGIRPAYLIGASIGALMGVFRARHADPDWAALDAIAKSTDRRTLFTSGTTRRRFGMPGLLPLRLRKAFGEQFAMPDGEPITLADLEVPYEAVVAGVRRRPFQRLPRHFRAEATEPALEDPGARHSPARVTPAIATRMWQATAFFDPRLVEPVVIGAEPGTTACRALDAAGFSASIPGVLHYDLAPDDDHPGAQAFAALMERRELAALIDGGMVANVPAELAWRRVQAGRLGTRNALVLAFDCFQPQWDPRHLWLHPITQAVKIQLRRNALFADAMVQFTPTLSPANLVPSAASIDHARGWGRASVEPLLPLLRELLRPIRWSGASG
ncbi:patatin-like phospholipase family protein [Patulibacter defluvii]|uniref:patatin-like phospholipase family protein n=1 Tax=Patulibacter defluvii TaxID=3095358 RepID=UPI002A751A13|nr:patatin-like phospholipase family protein [Patulibacter sp. DM4]